MKCLANNKSRIYKILQNSVGRLFDKTGSKTISFMRESNYLSVDESCDLEVGLLIESGEVVYFSRNDATLVQKCQKQ